MQPYAQLLMEQGVIQKNHSYLKSVTTKGEEFMRPCTLQRDKIIKASLIIQAEY